MGDLSYDMLGLDDINLGYAAAFEARHPIHAALEKLEPGCELQWARDERGISLFSGGLCVVRLSRKAEAEWSERLGKVRTIRVVAMFTRGVAQESEGAWRDRCRVPEWEVPAVEIVCS